MTIHCIFTENTTFDNNKFVLITVSMSIPYNIVLIIFCHFFRVIEAMYAMMYHYM